MPPVMAAPQSDVRKQFGAVVRQHRQAQGYSQESVADACGHHRTYVGAIERGERNVSIDNIARIAETLGVHIADLFPDRHDAT